MVLLVLGILVGFVVAAFSGGKIADIRRQKLHIWWTLPLAAVLFLLPLVVNDLGGASTMHALGYAAIMAFGAANLQLTGIPVVMVGIALNLVPLAFNGTVPVSEAGAVTAEIATIDTIADADLGSARTLEDGTMRFVFLGDTIPVSLLTQVYSFGDLIIAFGLANVMYRIVKPRKERFDDEQAGWPESTVPTEDVSSDPWTAMLRGEIDDADFAAKTGPQPGVVAAVATQNEWVQDPPVDTGPMMIMGTADSDADSDADSAPEDADLDAPDALDLSLTWADDPAEPEPEAASADPAAAPPPTAVPPTAVPPAAAPPTAAAPSTPALAEPPSSADAERSPFAPPAAAATAAVVAAGVAGSAEDDEPQPTAEETPPKVFDQEVSSDQTLASPSSPSSPHTPPQTAPLAAPATPSAPLAPPTSPTPVQSPPSAPPPPATPPAAEPTPPAPETAADATSALEAETSVEGRSFAPQLPDMDDDANNQSAFAAALAAFDDERRDYGRGSDSDSAPNEMPEHDTGPMPIVHPPADDAE